MAWSILVREDVMRVGTEGRGLRREGSWESREVGGGNTAKDGDRYESKGWLRTVIGKIYRRVVMTCMGIQLFVVICRVKRLFGGVNEHPAHIRKTTDANWVGTSA